jgi:cyanophycinase-like exopeptidase
MTQPATHVTNNGFQLKPLVLLADSQLLFFKESDQPYIRRLRQLFAPNQILSAAYIGASNGDEKEFYEMFELAMQSIDVTDCLHVTSALTATQLLFLEQADIILLSGGDISLGWQTLQKLEPMLRQSRRNGAVIIGTSAGSIQLGQLGWHNKPYLSNTDLFGTLGFIPAIFSAHEEKENWRFLRRVVSQTAGCLPGIGIQTGSGVIVAPDNNMQAIRKPMVTFTVDGNQLIQQPVWQIQLTP